MLIYQLLRYSVLFLIDGISNGYTLITIHELKPWVFFAFKPASHCQIIKEYGGPLKFSPIVIEINNELEVFVQISKTDVGFGNDRGRRPRLLQNPNEVFDICTNTSNKLFISILL